MNNLIHPATLSLIVRQGHEADLDFAHLIAHLEPFINRLPIEPAYTITSGDDVDFDVYASNFPYQIHAASIEPEVAPGNLALSIGYIVASPQDQTIIGLYFETNDGYSGGYPTYITPHN